MPTESWIRKELELDQVSCMKTYVGLQECEVQMSESQLLASLHVVF